MHAPGFEPHPLVRELFATLPKPHEDFPVDDRIRFLIAIRAIFDLVYKPHHTGEQINIERQLPGTRSPAKAEYGPTEQERGFLG